MYSYVHGNPLSFTDPLGLDGLATSFWAFTLIKSDEYGYWSPHPDAKGRISSLIGGRKSAKCNLFVNDMLTLGGDPPPRFPGDRVPSAKDWGDTATVIPGYYVIPRETKPEPGDIISTGSHVGIYFPSYNGENRIISASLITGRVEWNDFGFRSNQDIVIRRCDCDNP